MLLTDILEKNAKEIGSKTAFTMKMGYRIVSLSYQDVYDLARKTAVFLSKQGLKNGDKVLILAPNSPYWICVWWGCFLGGYVPVPLNIQSTAAMIKKIADQTEAKILFRYLHSPVSARQSEFPKNLKIYNVEFIKELVEDMDVSDFRKPKVSEEDLAELMYTSGTTGDPKGVMLTHKNILSNLSEIQKIATLSKNDKFLSILPLSHIFEQVIGFLLPFSKGISIVYVHSPAAIRNLLQEHRITIMAAVPEFLRLVMNKIEAQAAERGRGKIFSRLIKLSLALKLKPLQRLIFTSALKQFGGRLHTVISGGAPLDPELEKKWSALGIYLLQGYGLTETSPVVSTNSYVSHRLGSVGKILSGVTIKIVSDGEIWVKGPNVFQGYFKNEAKTKESFNEDGWFKTDDIGEMGQDGFLYIKGRKKYIIKGPGAQNVYPEDIEFELNKISDVKDSCVVGLEKLNGQVEIHAVLLLINPIEVEPRYIEKLVQGVNNNLASYQQIQGWSVWPEDDFPRSATRKVKKEEVIRWLKEKRPTPKSVSGKKTPLIQILAEITDHAVDQITERTKIVPELSLDSLLRIELVSRIEEKFGVVIEESMISPDTTVADLETLIKTRPPVKAFSPLKNWPRSWLISLDRILDQILLIFPLARIFIDLKVEGRKHLTNLPLPAIFMPNHLSYVDPLVLVMALPFRIRKRIAFAAAQDVLYVEYKKVAWLAEWYFNAFPFPRQEHENIKTGLEYLGRLLDKEWSIVVYPEGKVSVTGELQQFKRGAGLIAVEMDSYIVPVKITGTAEVVPYGKFLPRKRGKIIVRFGKPIKFKNSDSYIKVTEKLQQIMQKM